jgi:hypothetical protein
MLKEETSDHDRIADGIPAFLEPGMCHNTQFVEVLLSSE